MLSYSPRAFDLRDALVAVCIPTSHEVSNLSKFNY